MYLNKDSSQLMSSHFMTVQVTMALDKCFTGCTPAIGKCCALLFCSHLMIRWWYTTFFASVCLKIFIQKCVHLLLSWKVSKNIYPGLVILVPQFMTIMIYSWISRPNWTHKLRVPTMWKTLWNSFLKSITTLTTHTPLFVPEIYSETLF